MSDGYYQDYLCRDGVCLQERAQLRGVYHTPSLATHSEESEYSDYVLSVLNNRPEIAAQDTPIMTDYRAANALSNQSEYESTRVIHVKTSGGDNMELEVFPHGSYKNRVNMWVNGVLTQEFTVDDTDKYIVVRAYNGNKEELYQVNLDTGISLKMGRQGAHGYGIAGVLLFMIIATISLNLRLVRLFPVTVSLAVVYIVYKYIRRRVVQLRKEQEVIDNLHIELAEAAMKGDKDKEDEVYDKLLDAEKLFDRW